MPRIGSSGPVKAGGARSDTVMLVNIPANRKRVVAVSFPRDLAIKPMLCDAWDPETGKYGPVYDEETGTYGPEHHWGGWDVWTHKYNLLGLLAYYELTKDPQALATARKIGDLLMATFGEGKRDMSMFQAPNSAEMRMAEMSRYVVRRSMGESFWRGIKKTPSTNKG